MTGVRLTPARSRPYKRAMRQEAAMTDGRVGYEVRDGIGWAVLDRPEARNALTFAMYEALAAVCAAPGEGVKALVVTGAGDRAFAAGTDIAQFRAFAAPEDAIAYEARMDEVLGAIERAPVPTIAAIAGACTGGGAAIAACCDLRIAAQGMKFGFPIARTLGNCLSINNLARLSALVGTGRVRDLLFTARLMEAEEALTIGLVSEVVPDHASLIARAGGLARQLAEEAPLTLKATKEALIRLRERASAIDDRDLLTMCYGSADFCEGLEAFLARRPPRWQGR
jgi:enoyl-CoA hydratase/carnithine racemase